MQIHIILQCDAHHGPESAVGKSIIRMILDPLKKRLAEYLEFFKPQILALPEKPLYLISRQCLGHDRINLISVPEPGGCIERLVDISQFSEVLPCLSFRDQRPLGNFILCSAQH